MRHIYAYRVFYLLAALIVGACALFAWIRSENIAIVPDSRNAVPNVRPAPAADHNRSATASRLPEIMLHPMCRPRKESWAMVRWLE
jgi:hypothetical protein